MVKIWHSASAMKSLAGGLLALALAAIAATFVANNKWVGIQGPGAVQAIDADTLWLGVNEDLWILDSLGHRNGQRSARELGFSEAVSIIALAPGNQVLLTSRADPEWQLVDRATLARVRSIRPQWPEDIAKLPLHAVHVAVAPDGSMAAATGGGHTVVLFDREGRFLARTPADTYRFTNGLWWSSQGWWTTDTNRFRLHLLDARTLAVKETLPLWRLPPNHPYLGEAIPSQGGPQAGTGLMPLATLSRLGYLMEPGHVVDVFADGSQAMYNREPIAQLRDVAWFDRQLLVVDGDRFEVRRFDKDRHAVEPFGDNQVRGAFLQMRSDREFWRTVASRNVLLLAAALLIAGLVAYARHRRLAVLATVAARETAAAPEPVAPAVATGDLAGQRLKLHGLPFAVRLVVLALSLFVLFPLLHWWLIGPRPDDLMRSLRLLLLALAGPMAIVVLWQQWRHNRLADRAEYEGVVNRPALEWLRAHDDFDRVKLEAEVPRETVYLPGWRPRWLLVTNRRILLFIASAHARRLQSEWPRRAVVFAGAPDQHSSWQRVFQPVNLVLTFTTGTTLHLRCASGVTARRVAQLLMSSPAVAEEDSEVMIPLAPRRRWHEVLASFVVPGTGQWLQGRFATGVVLFTAALLLCIYGWAPVVWALHGPKMEVSSTSIAMAVIAWLLVPLVASSDAWRFSATRR